MIKKERDRQLDLKLYREVDEYIDRQIVINSYSDKYVMAKRGLRARLGPRASQKVVPF